PDANDAQPQRSETDTHATRPGNLDPVYRTARKYRMLGRCSRAKYTTLCRAPGERRGFTNLTVAVPEYDLTSWTIRWCWLLAKVGWCIWEAWVCDSCSAEIRRVDASRW